MVKIKEATQEQLNMIKGFKSSKNQIKAFKSIIGLSSGKKYGIGDTAVRVDNAKQLDVFMDEFKGRNFYYIIVNVIDEKTAFAYSLYPRV